MRGRPWRQLRRHVADTETEAHLKRLKEIIRAAGAKGITKSEITRASQWLKSRDRDEILLTLDRKRGRHDGHAWFIDQAGHGLPDGAWHGPWRDSSGRKISQKEL